MDKQIEDADEKWMDVAIDEANNASTRGEVPIGACIVDAGGELIARAGNRTITDCDPTAHAEIVALRIAAAAAGNYRLTGATVYSTIEPCVMCAGALVTARISRLVYGSRDERFGAIHTNFGIGVDAALNHRFDVSEGILAERCRALMQDFFRQRR